MLDLGSAFWLSFYTLQVEMQKEFQKNGATSKVSAHGVIRTIIGKDTTADNMGRIDTHSVLKNAEPPRIHSYGSDFNE
jgi:hypothetical protein